MRVLVACEYSGVVRRAFEKEGHAAYSCDLLPSEDNSPHHKTGDVREMDLSTYDLIIAHPPCTYLCNSGVRWLHPHKSEVDEAGDVSEDEMWRIWKRFSSLEDARDFFYFFFDLTRRYPEMKVCIENPIPHKYAGLPQYSQIIQPYQFGHLATKATCLWLQNLPLLKPTEVLDKKDAVGEMWRLPPSKDRGKLRSRTYEGIAEAMAGQWK